MRVAVSICAILVSAAGLGSALAEERCLSDWSVAAGLVKANGLASVEQLTEKARGRINGTIVKTLLCETASGSWTYRLVVRELGGTLRTIVVDAADPFRE